MRKRRDTETFPKAADMTDDELAAIVAKARLTVVKKAITISIC